MSDKIISAVDIKKSYYVADKEIPVLKGVSLDILKGQFVVIFGPSGCGKSTMLYVILGLEEPTQGTLHFMNNDMYTNTSEDDRAEFRKNNVGMVYQQSNWIRSLTVIENIAFPLTLMGVSEEEAVGKAEKYLMEVGMFDWAHYIPTELSSGQQQRISLARALVNEPEVIIADEPTGNLDYESGQDIMQLFSKLNKEKGKTIIMVTHDLEYITYASNIFRMLDGQVIGTYEGNKEKEKLLKEISFKRVQNLKNNVKEKTNKFNTKA